MKATAEKKAARFAHAFHSLERVQWVNASPCIACGQRPTLDSPSQNAHTESGGMGRRAHYSTIVPLCGLRRGVARGDGKFPGFVEGCHAELHRIGVHSFERMHRVDLKTCARDVQRRWLARHPDDDTFTPPDTEDGAACM